MLIIFGQAQVVDFFRSEGGRTYVIGSESNQ